MSGFNTEGEKVSIANVARDAARDAKVSRITAKKYIDTPKKNKYNY